MTLSELIAALEALRVAHGGELEVFRPEYFDDPGIDHNGMVRLRQAQPVTIIGFEAGNGIAAYTRDQSMLGIEMKGVLLD